VTLVFHLRPGQQQGLPRLQGSSMVTVPCEPHTSVGDLYRGAAWYLSPSQDPTPEELEAAAWQLRLVRGITRYANLSSSLLEAGMQQGHVVHVLQQQQELPPGFGITIQTLTGKEVPMLVHSDMLVLEVKQLFQDREGIPPCQQRYVVQGQQVEDLATLGECGVQEGQVVHCILRLGGC
jgi:hypothetical protein